VAFTYSSSVESALALEMNWTLELKLKDINRMQQTLMKAMVDAYLDYCWYFD
jgi:hypothetical protein